MRYFLYHHDYNQDSFWGMPRNMIGEWDGAITITFYAPDGSSFTMRSDENDLESGILSGALEEIDVDEYAKLLLTTGAREVL